MSTKLDFEDLSGLGKFIVVILIMLIVIAGTALSGWILMLLWNWLMPIIWCTAPHLTFLQACGFLLLLQILGRCLGFFSKKE